MPIGEIHLRLNSSSGKCRDREALQGECIGKIQRTDFGPDLQVDESVQGEGRREVQAHAKLLELNSDSSEPGTAGRLENGKGEFTAGEKTCFLPGRGQQIRLGQNFQNIFLLESLDQLTRDVMTPTAAKALS